MNRFICVFCLLFITSSSFAYTQKYFNDNSNLEITISSINYNRLHVQNDKITKAYFPENSLVVRNDEDGSLYVISKEPKEFTIFLTTENGRHISASINSDESLGQTIEFIPIIKPIKKSASKVVKVENALSSLIKDMMQNHTPENFSKKRHFGKARRLSQGITLIPKITYQGNKLKGEVIEIYNASKQKILLQEDNFKTKFTQDIYTDNLILEPHQKTVMYLVSENHHG